jgi:ribosomal protein L4
LSAKLVENRIIIIKDEKLTTSKTKIMKMIISPFKQSKLLFITDFNPEENFQKASQNIHQIQHLNPAVFSFFNLLCN